MRFDTFIPADQLKPFVRQFVISENELESEYKVFPSSGMVLGFQYTGTLSSIQIGKEIRLASSGITGMSDRFKVFRNSAGTGTLLVYFTETGFSHFSSHPANELFNISVSLENIFERSLISQTEEKLSAARSDSQRLKIVERFLLSQLKNVHTDKLIVEAVNLIYQSNGSIRIKELNDRLFISKSPLEKRFRKVVGTTPKKFASIVRFNTVLNNIGQPKSLTEICYEHNFFDQAHLIRDFKQFTGDTPEHFKNSRR